MVFQSAFYMKSEFGKFEIFEVGKKELVYSICYLQPPFHLGSTNQIEYEVQKYLVSFALCISPSIKYGLFCCRLLKDYLSQEEMKCSRIP